MNVLNNTANNNDAVTFTRASEVQIPDAYHKRFKFGIEDLDAVFGGNGFMPGQVFTLSGAPGAMKTSFLLQCLELLERNGKSAAYISGEEPEAQISMTCKRLNVSLPKLANITDIDVICDVIVKHGFDIVILDSLPTLTTKKRMNKRQLEEYVVTKIIKTAKEHNIVIGVVQHQTKQGLARGSNLMPHSADTCMMLRKNKEDDAVRDIEVMKNRYGVSTSFSFPISSSGFTFEAVDYTEEQSSSSSSSKKASKADIIISALDTPKTIAQIVQETSISGGYLTTLVRELTTQGKIKKEGRGTDALYSKI